MLVFGNTITNFVFVCLAATTHAQVSVLSNDLATIDQDFKYLAIATDNYGGSYGSAMAYKQIVAKLDSDTKQALPRCQASSKLSSSDCQSLISYVNSPLEPDVKAAIDKLIQKKDVFTAYNNATPCTDLKQLLADLKNLYQCFKRLCPNVGPAAVKIGRDFQTGIRAYC